MVEFKTKAEARNYLEQLQLSTEQEGAARRAVSRATKNSTISISFLKEDRSILIAIKRLGRDGSQVMESVIDNTGRKVNVQKAFNIANQLVHYDPKTIPVSKEAIQKALQEIDLSEVQRATANRLVENITPQDTVDITKYDKPEQKLVIKIIDQSLITEFIIEITGQYQEKSKNRRN